jgi:hypothetical protein
VGLGLVWTQRLQEKYFTSIGDRTPFIQFVLTQAHHYVMKQGYNLKNLLSAYFPYFIKKDKVRLWYCVCMNDSLPVY